MICTYIILSRVICTLCEVEKCVRLIECDTHYIILIDENHKRRHVDTDLRTSLSKTLFYNL